MADVAVVTTGTEAAAATPAETPVVPAKDAAAAPPAAAPAKEAPTGPLSRREAWQQMREGVKSRAAARAEPPAEPEKPAEKAAEPGKDEKPAEQPAPTTDAPAEAPKPAAEEPKPAEPAAPAASAITVAIEEGHPLHGMNGITKLTAANEQEERVLRALLKGSYARVSELNAANARVAELQDKINRHEADQAANAKWKDTPEYKRAVEVYQNMKRLEQSEELPEGTADQYWKTAVDSDFKKIANQIYEEKQQEHQAAASTEAAKRFFGMAWERTAQLPAAVTALEHFPKWFQEAGKAFDAELGMGHFSHIDGVTDPEQRQIALLREFQKFFGARLTREPDVAAALKAADQQEQSRSTAAQREAAEKKRAEDAIAAAAVDKYKAELAAKRAAVPPHPLGNLNGAGRTTQPAAPSGQDQVPANSSVHDLRRASRVAAREDARRRFSS